MDYITCDDYDGKNSPNRSIEMRTAFSQVKILFISVQLYGIENVNKSYVTGGRTSNICSFIFI